MSFNASEFAWNSVDIRGDDGLLHNGRVIDAVDGGLVVDFGGAGSKLIPYGRVFHNNYSNYLCCAGTTVEVLLRLQPQDPWKWYPGELLEHFGRVSVVLPERELKGFVVAERIRLIAAEEEMAAREIGPERFLIKLVAVPSEHGAAYPGDDQLIGMFNAHCRQHGYWMMATKLVKNADDGFIKRLVVLGVFEDEHDIYEPFHPFHDWIKCIQPLDELVLFLLKTSTDPVEKARFLSAAPYPDGSIQSLSRDPSIFPGIFECLTTIEQSKIRGVCADWEAILQSSYIRRVLTVCHPPDGPGHYTGMYQFAQCLSNCWSHLTRILVLHGKPTPGSGPYQRTVLLPSVARLLPYILAEKGLAGAETVILTREWQFSDDNWVNDLWEALVSLAGIGKRLVLKSVGVHLSQFFGPGSAQLVSVADLIYITVHFSNTLVSRQLTVSDFWALLNSRLNDWDVDMERAAKWIREIPETISTEIAQTLNYVHALDPRNGVCYNPSSLVPYAAADLKCISARQLTKLTLYAMIQLVEKPQLIFYVR